MPKALKGCLAIPPERPLTVVPNPPSSENPCLLSNISFLANKLLTTLGPFS